jgi:phospho-N-acetylmuramoyl-pentapeptide-transferase
MMDSLVLSIWLGLIGAGVALAAARGLIAWQRREGLGQPIREYGPDIHQHKKGTPTMGGLALLIAFGFLWLWSWHSGSLTPHTQLIFLAIFSFGLIGFLDDALKFWRRNSDGLAGRYKLLLQMTVSALFGWIAYHQGLFGEALKIPFASMSWDLSTGMAMGLVFIVFLGTVNAVNFNDGLDGLAMGTSLIALIALAVFSTFQKQTDLLSFLIISIGILLGLFWWNVHPAQIFLGDTGSFALGGLLAATAVAIRVELFLPLIAFVPMLEVFSDIVQVASFKWFKKRVFKVAPLHHHFERAKGVNYEFILPNAEWPEPLITARFWIIAALFAMIGLAAYR